MRQWFSLSYGSSTLIQFPLPIGGKGNWRIKMGIHEKQITLDYMTDMLGQLIRLATEQDKLFLAYLIGMALAEARPQIQNSKK